MNGVQPEPVRIEVGSGRYTFADPDEKTGKSVSVWYHRPSGFGPDSPIVMVMHGQGRNADGYRDNWVEAADTYGFLLLVPEFDIDQFPGDVTYNLGNRTPTGAAGETCNPKDKWSFFIIDRIFDQAREAVGSNRTRFSLFGHSAGGQFVHRYMTFTPSDSVDIAVAANPGWYTMPFRDERYPYGLDGSDASEATVEAFLAKRLIILLGEADTLKTPNLRQTPEANRQGPNRFTRGQNYFEKCEAEARRLGVAFTWRLETVPEVGHTNRLLAMPAARLMAEYWSKNG